MVENLAGDNGIEIKNAWLKVGNREQTQQIDENMTTAKFTVDLKAGTTCFQTAINLPQPGKTLSTACVYVKFIGEADVNNLEDYFPSIPDRVLRDGFEQKVIPYD